MLKKKKQERKKARSKLEIERNYLDLIEHIYKKKPTANIELQRETQSFPSKIRYKAKILPLTTPSQHHTGSSG